MKKRFLALVFLLSVIVSASWAKSIHAEENTVDNAIDLRQALIDAQGNGVEDTINLEPGVYDLSGGKLTYEVAEGGNLIIKPANTGDVVILDGGAASRILEITNSGGTGETVTIKNITFQNAIGTALNSKAPAIVLENCKFIGNMPDFDLSPATRLGGGAELTGKVTLTNNLFNGNFGNPDMCGGVTIMGGPVVLDSNIFVGNRGGGPYLGLYGAGGACIRPALYSSTVTQNDVILTNNVFDANFGTYFFSSGGLYIGQNSGLPPYVVITNNTFVNNSDQYADTWTGMTIGLLYSGAIHIYNNIFWNNLDNTYPPVLRDLAASVPASGTLNVEYNLFSSDTSTVLTNPNTVSNNIDSQDPGLSADYHLPANSPLLQPGNSGLNSAPERPDHDFEGDPRPATSEDAVDIGADEFTPPPEAGDINDDGNINLTDALLSLQVVSNIMPSVSLFKIADVNGDGVIGLEEAIYALQFTSQLRIPPDNSFMSIKRTGIKEIISIQP
jgi:hypothetical protein